MKSKKITVSSQTSPLLPFLLILLAVALVFFVWMKRSGQNILGASTDAIAILNSSFERWYVMPVGTIDVVPSAPQIPKKWNGGGYVFVDNAKTIKSFFIREKGFEGSYALGIQASPFVPSIAIDSTPRTLTEGRYSVNVYANRFTGDSYVGFVRVYKDMDNSTGEGQLVAESQIVPGKNWKKYFVDFSVSKKSGDYYVELGMKYDMEDAKKSKMEIVYDSVQLSRIIEP